MITRNYKLYIITINGHCYHRELISFTESELQYAVDSLMKYGIYCDILHTRFRVASVRDVALPISDDTDFDL